VLAPLSIWWVVAKHSAESSLIGTVSKMAKVAAVAGSLGDEHSLLCDVTGIGNMMVMRPNFLYFSP
jgi:hypothetical protein